MLHEQFTHSGRACLAYGLEVFSQVSFQLGALEVDVAVLVSAIPVSPFTSVETTEAGSTTGVPIGNDLFTR